MEHGFAENGVAGCAGPRGYVGAVSSASTCLPFCECGHVCIDRCVYVGRTPPDAVERGINMKSYSPRFPSPPSNPTHPHLKLPTPTPQRSSPPNPNQPPNPDSPPPPQPLNPLPLPRPNRPLKPAFSRTLHLLPCRPHSRNPLLAQHKPHRAQHASVRTRLDNRMEPSQPRVVDGALQARAGGFLAVARAESRFLVRGEDSDLASPQHGFEGQAREEFHEGGEEGGEGVGGWCEEGVDGEGGAEEEGGG